MAEVSYPSPNHNSRNVTDKEYEDLSAFFSGDGVWGNPGSGPVVDAGVGLTVVINASKAASVRGHQWSSGSADFTLAVSANASSSTRMDWVVLRLDRSTWDVNAVVKAGTPGAGLPDLEYSVSAPGVWEMPLAQVTVPPSATSVTVQRHELYIGSRNRPCTSETRPVNPSRGEINYELDTGKWVGWNGSSWRNIYQNTGWISLGSGFTTWEDYVSNVGVRYGDTIHLRLAKRRVDGTFSVNDTDGSKLATLPAVLTPRSNHWFAVNITGGAGSATVEVRNTGEVWVKDNQKDVTPGRVLLLTCSFPIE